MHLHKVSSHVTNATSRKQAILGEAQDLTLEPEKPPFPPPIPTLHSKKEALRQATVRLWAPTEQPAVTPAGRRHCALRHQQLLPDGAPPWTRHEQDVPRTTWQAPLCVCFRKEKPRRRMGDPRQTRDAPGGVHRNALNAQQNLGRNYGNERFVFTEKQQNTVSTLPSLPTWTTPAAGQPQG